MTSDIEICRKVRGAWLLLLLPSVAGFAAEAAKGDAHTNAVVPGAPAAAGSESPTAEHPPTATISTARVRRGQLRRQLTVYGSIVPATGSTHTISLPYDAIMDRWTIAAGARLAAGAVLGEAHPTAEAAANRSEALASESTAQDELKGMRQRHELALATQAELLQAESAARIATMRAAAWRNRSPDEHQTLTAPMAGILLSVAVTAGQVIPAGTPIAVMASGTQEARLGLEPADASDIPPDALFTVILSRPAAASQLPPIAATMISALVDPDSRLVTALVPIPVTPAFGMLAFGTPVTATVDRQGPSGLLVPRGALVRSEDPAEWAVFTIDHALAHRVVVSLLAESGTDAVVEAATLSPDQEVAVTGSGVLIDGMHVQSLVDTPQSDKP